MKKEQWRNNMPCVLSTGSVFAFSGVLFLLYQESQCLLFRLGGIFLLVLAAVNLILLLFGRELKNPSASIPKDSDSPLEEKDPVPSGGEVENSKKIKGKYRSKKLFRRLSRKILRFFRVALFRSRHLFVKIYRPMQIVLLGVVLVWGFTWFNNTAKLSEPADTTVSYLHLVLLVILFVTVIVFDKLCKHTELSSKFHAMILRNTRVFFALSKVILVVIMLDMVLKLLNVYDIQKYVTYLISALFYYAEIMIIISVAVKAIRKEMSVSPGLVIYIPFLDIDVKELEFISFLESNTGITLRSLWSINYVKDIIPYALIGAVLLFWVSTGIVYVQSDQQAAVYRMGDLQEEVLSPGLHLTLPYPFDRAEVCNVTTVNRMTIGYKSTENIDNVWTEAHGNDEYRLLLGSGNELVSINLRIEYKISDLKQYLKTATVPEQILEAKAYELVTSRTINTDLDTILSADRETFSNTFYEELTADIAELNMGLEVVSVILESIHPPVEVAQVYQDFIGAEIEAERLILEAEARAAVKRAQADTMHQQFINGAQADYYEMIADARNEIAEFMAAVEVSDAFADEYAYHKYLEALCTAYKNAKLIILGNDVDSGRLYIGNVTGT